MLLLLLLQPEEDKVSLLICDQPYCFLWHGSTIRCVDLRPHSRGCGNAVSLQDYLQLAVAQIQLV